MYMIYEICHIERDCVLYYILCIIYDMLYIHGSYTEYYTWYNKHDTYIYIYIIYSVSYILWIV